MRMRKVAQVNNYVWERMKEWRKNGIGTGKVEERETYRRSEKRLTGGVFDGTPKRPWCQSSKLDSLLMLKFPPSSIWGTKSELVSIKLELNMRIIQNSLSQRCHSFCFRRCTRASWKRRRQGQRHVRCMGWWQSAVQRNSEREDGIALRYYWKNLI